MASLKGYNYTQQSSATFQCGMLNANDLQNVSSHSFSTEYGTATLTKSGNSIGISIDAPVGSYTNYSVSSILSAAGIRNYSPIAGNLVGSIPEGSSDLYGFNRNYTSLPTFRYSKTYYSVFDFNEYGLILNRVNMNPIQIDVQDNYPACLSLIFIPTSSDGLSGCLGFILGSDGFDTGSLNIGYYPDSTNIDDAYNPSAGEKGFHPTDDPTKNDWPGIGGRPSDDPQKTDPDYPSDSILQPGAPDESVASAAGSGFIIAYKMDTANLRELGKCLFSQNLTDALLNVLINPLDFIVSLNVFPCSPSVGAAVPLKLGRWECRSGSLTGALGFNASGNPLTHQFSNPPLDFGTISIPENWGSFLDYTHTRIELYLPFIGTVDLDVSECMGGTVNVQYTIDYFTGMCVANVLCLRPITLASGKVIGNRPAQHSYQGNCAIQVPLSAESYGSMLGNIINSCTRLIGNPAMAPVSIAEGMLNGLNPSVTTKGSIVANAGFCSVLKPYVRITRPVTAAPASYQQVVGYPSYINTSLSYCEGFCQCEDINLSGITGATESELEEIRSLCKDGIII